ncbi:MAG: hypothetical protein QM800_02970 [Paludibacter sp.]
MIHKKTKSTKSIGLIVSGRIELQALLSYVSVVKKLHLSTYPVYYFNLNGYDVFVVLTGYKLIDITEATTLLIKKISPQLIISYGTGTAIDTEMKTGDVLYANSVTMLENNVYDQYRVISTLRQDIRRFVFDIIFGYKARMFVGTIVTVNNNDTLKNYDKLKFTHPVLDLEMLRIAQIAGSFQITALALRGITDNIAIGGIKNLNTVLNFTWHYDRLKAIRIILQHPLWVLEIPHFLHRKYKASKHVASSLYSLLNVLSIDSVCEADDMEYRI